MVAAHWRESAASSRAGISVARPGGRLRGESGAPLRRKMGNRAAWHRRCRGREAQPLRAQRWSQAALRNRGDPPAGPPPASAAG